jgi:FkbM family methyltransferase
MPGTAIALKEAAQKLAWDERGFIVTHAAMSKNDGVVLFPLENGVGVENKGIGNCAKNPNRSNCVNVTLYSLDTFVEKFVSPNLPINYLSVDVEGYDMDVLLGGMNHALSRIEYLEFEYNWMGSWAKQHLSTLIDLLDQRGFRCYWPGYGGYIWRITGCWLDLYKVHTWSNVACVNENVDSVRSLADEMERMFLATLSKEENIKMDSMPE